MSQINLKIVSLKEIQSYYGCSEKTAIKRRRELVQLYNDCHDGKYTVLHQFMFNSLFS